MRWLVTGLLIALFSGVVLADAPLALPVKGETSLKRPLLPKSSPPSSRIIHLDLMDSSTETRLALTVLQGLVNRDTPRIYISQDPGWHGPHNVSFWLDNLKKRGYEVATLEDPLEAFSMFAGVIRGAVIYDSDLEENVIRRHKLNAVTLYCAVHDAIPLTAELNESLKLPVLLDVRGKYDKPLDAYTWAYEELWPHASRDAVALLRADNIVMRDYMVAHRIMPFWMSHGMGLADEAVCYRFIDELRANGFVLGCWAGYGEQPPGRLNEPDIQRLASLRGKIVLVTDGNFNTTLTSGLEFSLPEPPERPALPELDPEKVYLTFAVTDGDNLQYLQQHFKSGQWWDDPARGQVPVGWSLNPIGFDLIPDVMQYLLETATPMDEFFCSTAGIGLVTPSLYGRDRYSNAADVYDEYIKLTGSYMQDVGLEIIALGDTSNVPWTRADFEHVSQTLPWLKGILADYGRSLGVNPSNSLFQTSNGILAVRSLAAPGGNPEGSDPGQTLADAIRNHLPGTRPFFMHVCLVNWFHSPSRIKAALENLGDGFVAVLPSQFFELAAKAAE